MRVPDFQIMGREDQPGRPADELLERDAIALLAASDEDFVSFVHAAPIQ